MKLSRWAAKRARRRYGNRKVTGSLKTLTRATMTHLVTPSAIPLQLLEQNLIRLQGVVLSRIREKKNDAEECEHYGVVRSA
jgi:hypothetical protein